MIHSRATNAQLIEQLMPGNESRSFRTSLNTLGDGYVEAIDDDTLRAIAQNQPLGMQGDIVLVPVLESNGRRRVGRFGWKNQQASLLSFSADAYLNEMGVTSPLAPTENTSNGRSIAAFDPVGRSGRQRGGHRAVRAVHARVEGAAAGSPTGGHA